MPLKNEFMEDEKYHNQITSAGSFKVFDDRITRQPEHFQAREAVKLWFLLLQAREKTWNSKLMITIDLEN